LKQAGLVGQLAKVVKIIKSGSISKAVTLNGIGVSAGAKAAIEAAGGSIGLNAEALKARHQWQLTRRKLQRPESSATCVAGLCFCCWPWSFIGWVRTFLFRVSIRRQLQQLFKGQQGGILSLFNMFSGGALSRFTVFALGIMPYISASIIMQLMTYVVPTFEQLKKEGESGRRKITQYTRYGTLGLALFQSLGHFCGVSKAQPGLVVDPGMGFRMTAVVTLTARERCF
jgi:hypothetical protein